MTGAEIGGVSLGTAILMLGGAVGVVVALTFFVAVVKGFLYICRPNEILIFSGRKHTLPNGTSTGYKVVRRGWAVRIPILETVNRMDMRLFMAEVAVSNAYSKNGIPLDVKAIANVKISSNPSHVRNAVERFLGTNPQQISVVARQTLEGVLREVLAQLTPEEVNEDRLKFADSLAAEVEQDLSKLGLHLDVLKIQHVTDDAGVSHPPAEPSVTQDLHVRGVGRVDAAHDRAVEGLTCVVGAVPIGDHHAGDPSVHDHLHGRPVDRRTTEQLRRIHVGHVEDHQSAVRIEVVQAIAVEAIQVRLFDRARWGCRRSLRCRGSSSAGRGGGVADAAGTMRAVSRAWRHRFEIALAGDPRLGSALDAAVAAAEGEQCRAKREQRA